MIQQGNLRGFVGRISRPKITGPGRHAGVLLPSGLVADFTRAGARIVTLDEFAQGKPVRAEQGADPSALLQIEGRARFSLGRTLPYDLLKRNCEHYANHVMGKTPESPQVAGLFLGALGIFFLASIG